MSASARVRGPEHPDTIVAQVQLGENLIDLERFPEAAATLRHAAETLDRIVGPAHRYSLSAWSDYAVAACNSHDEDAGLAALRHVLDVRTAALPANDWHMAANHTVTGMCLVRLHRYDEAGPLLLRGVADLEASRGAGFYQTQKAYAVLRDMYRAEGRSGEAERFAAKIDK
jgi:tetratricopeptide (TPR) repeat protein